MKHLFFTILSIFILTSCGDNQKSFEIKLTDARPPDAGKPDAEVCLQTSCGDSCVDTTSDSEHCGGCNMACASLGQICSGALPCECPPLFLPTEIGGGGFDQVQAMAGTYFAAAVILGTPVHVALVVYKLDQELGVEVELSENGVSPIVAAGYDVNINTQTAKTPYMATTGFITFDTVCETGASGTMRDIEMMEVAGLNNPTPVDGGCTMSYAFLTFNIGSCPVPSTKASVGHAVGTTSL